MHLCASMFFAWVLGTFVFRPQASRRWHREQKARTILAIMWPEHRARLVRPLRQVLRSTGGNPRGKLTASQKHHSKSTGRVRPSPASSTILWGKDDVLFAGLCSTGMDLLQLFLIAVLRLSILRPPMAPSIEPNDLCMDGCFWITAHSSKFCIWKMPEVYQCYLQCVDIP